MHSPAFVTYKVPKRRQGSLFYVSLCYFYATLKLILRTINYFLCFDFFQGVDNHDSPYFVAISNIGFDLYSSITITQAH